MGANRALVATVMVSATIVVNVLAVIARFRFETHAPLGLAVGMTAMFAFVGMLALSQAPNHTWQVTETSMRTAIASAIVAEYLALISMVTFSVGGPEQLSPMAQTLVSSFTSIVGIVNCVLLWGFRVC